MKPKDLKPPFSWNERRPLIDNGLLVVPQHYKEHASFDLSSFDALFPTKQPLRIEYCSGNGTWLAERAKNDPNSNWLGVEIRFDRVRKICSKKNNLSLDNLAAVWGEAFTFTHHYLPSSSVEEVFINFPDPWPKRRHEKHRLLGPAFIEELARILRPEGTVTFVTDDPDYRDRAVQNFLASSHFSPYYPAPHYTTDVAHYGSSYFDTLWREMGRTIHHVIFKNIA